MFDKNDPETKKALDSEFCAGANFAFERVIELLDGKRSTTGLDGRIDGLFQVIRKRTS